MKSGLAIVAPVAVMLAGCPAADWTPDCVDGREYLDFMTLTCKPLSGGEIVSECVDLPPARFTDEPFLVWIGEPGKAPECPARAPQWAIEGYADLAADYSCEPCECTPPTGSCALSPQITAHNAKCAGMATIAMSFDATSPWAGGCDNSNPVQAGATCAGSPCVQSITVEPPQVVENGCGVVAPTVPKKWITPYWKTEMLGCKGRVDDKDTTCRDRGMTRALSAEGLPGWRQCIMYYGEGDYSADCPAETYPEAFVFYDKHVDDDRKCSTCSCGLVQGSVCSADIFIYDAANCAHIGAAFYSVRSDDVPPCNDVMSGLGLLSKAALNVKYTPGVCMPQGGEQIGSVIPHRPTTFCCKPPSSSP